MRTCKLCQLHSKCTYTARCALNKYRLPGTETTLLKQPGPCGHSGEWYTRSMLQRNAFRSIGNFRSTNSYIFRISPIARNIIAGKHFITFFKSRYKRTCFCYSTCHVPAKYKWKNDRHTIPGMSRTHFPVDGIDRSSCYLYQYIIRPKLRHWRIFIFQYIGTAIGVYSYCFHNYRSFVPKQHKNCTAQLQSKKKYRHHFLMAVQKIDYLVLLPYYQLAAIVASA